MTKKSELDSAIEMTEAQPKVKELPTILAAGKSAPLPVRWGELWSFDAANSSRPTLADYGDLKVFALGKAGKGESDGTIGHFDFGWDNSKAPMVIYPLTNEQNAAALAERDQWLAGLSETDRAAMIKIIGNDEPAYGIVSGNRRFRALPYAYCDRIAKGQEIDTLTPIAVRLTKTLSKIDLEILNFSENLQPTPGAKRPTSQAQLRQAVSWYKAGVIEKRLEPVFGSRFRAQQMMAVARIIVQGPKSGAPWKDADDFLRRIALDPKDAEYIDTANLLAGKNKEDLRKAGLALEPKVTGVKRDKKDRMSKADALQVIRMVVMEGKDAIAQRGLSKTEWATLAARNPESLFYQFVYSYVCSRPDDRDTYLEFVLQYDKELNAVFQEAKPLLTSATDEE